MDADAPSLDVAVIGAGWAGLSVSYGLRQAGRRHVVYERARIGETWRTQRWTAFRMNTPNVMTILPGERYAGDEPEGYMTRDDFVAMVEGYARRHSLPVRENTPVFEVRPEGGSFAIGSAEGRTIARSVVVATGNLNVPRRPALSARLPAGIVQMDGSDYRDPASLPAGAILVIGCGNSGGQIAEEIARAGRRVYLSTGRNGRVPRRYRGRDIFLWLTDTGRMGQPRTTSSGRGLIGATHTISLQSLSADGAILLGRLEGLEGGALLFADSLAESVAAGDRMSDELRREIDDHIRRNGIDAPPAVADPAETVTPRFADPPIRRLDLAEAGIGTVIWSTGFTGDFGWLRVPGAQDDDGNPVQAGGLSVPGVYFAGLDTLDSLRAGTVLAAQEEADRIVRHIVSRLGSLPPPATALS